MKKIKLKSKTNNDANVPKEKSQNFWATFFIVILNIAIAFVSIFLIFALYIVISFEVLSFKWFFLLK